MRDEVEWGSQITKFSEWKKDRKQAEKIRKGFFSTEFGIFRLKR